MTPLKVIEGTRGHQQFFANNLGYKWDRDVGLVSLRLSPQGHRMMYNLTYLGHWVTLPWLDLRSNFGLDLSRSDYTWFDAPWRDKHDRVTIVVLYFTTKTLSSKNHFGQIWPFDLWWHQFWPELKNDRSSFRMIFPEFSNAVFLFVLGPSRFRQEHPSSTCWNEVNIRYLRDHGLELSAPWDYAEIRFSLMSYLTRCRKPVWRRTYKPCASLIN